MSYHVVSCLSCGNFTKNPFIFKMEGKIRDSSRSFEKIQKPENEKIFVSNECYFCWVDNGKDPKKFNDCLVRPK